MSALVPTAAHGSAAGTETTLLAPRPSAFDAMEFAELSDMIGLDGVLEMVAIFERETRQRLIRVATGKQEIAATVREMHTLKGAASTVAAPNLATLGRMLELAARRGIAPTRNDVASVERALEDWLTAVNAWNEKQLAG